MIQVSYRISRDQFVRAHRAHLRRTLLSGKNLVFLTMALALLAIQVNLFGSSGIAIRAFWVVWAGILGLMLIAYWVLPSRMYRKDGNLADVQTLKMDDEKIEWNLGGREFSFHWDRISRLLENGEFIWVLPSQGFPIVLPKSSITESELEKIRDYLGSHLKKVS